jgi:putative oxidoreductase
MLAYMFIVSGYGKIAGFAGAAKFMASKGMPLVEPLLVGAIIIELIGGLMLAVGFKARWAAWAIFGFVAIATVIFHDFWNVPAEQVYLQKLMFEKNLAIMGGMLYIALMGPGRLSLDKS